ncbi:DegT/DnrJ/EryC1/StrS family aminotransferase [Spirosoma aerolatum]|uniref:DegT/DnrJ/EryC1/StrS family aminotransferase n=1 Tax=Spirosoma aerolatum TaxID=1211326 RepID=UPI0009AEBB7B|nr:DegT/DnrJ/EryC1/StrS family aminotransferase [Spirosoma aerolatum]
MIPRFDYSFSLRDIFISIASVANNKESNVSSYQDLFPSASVFEIPSARWGIQCALQALGLAPGARVGVQPYTCSSVMAAIQSAGLEIVFIDINAEFTLDQEDLKKKLHQLEALIVTHTFGVAAQLESIRKLASHLPIIEDCAHAFLCHYNDQSLGSFFDVSVFSFGYGKFPILGHGGIIVINNKKYAKLITTHISRLKPAGLLSELIFVGKRVAYSLIYSGLGYTVLHNVFQQYITTKNQRIQSRSFVQEYEFRSVRQLLKNKWKHLPDLAMKQRQNALQIIKANESVVKAIYNVDDKSNCLAVVFIVDDRDRLYNHLIRHGIGAGKHFQYAAVWASAYGYENGSCPQFEQLVNRVITIPCYSKLTKSDIIKINKVIARFIQENIL